MFNYKSPLSRILEKSAEDTPSATKETETVVSEEIQSRSDEFIEDVEAEADVAKPEVISDQAADASQPVESSDDFMVLQSAFEDDDMSEEENIFAEAADVESTTEETASEQAESNTSMAEVLTLMTAREARSAIAPVTQAPAVAEVAEEVETETLSDVLTMPEEETVVSQDEVEVVAEVAAEETVEEVAAVLPEEVEVEVEVEAEVEPEAEVEAPVEAITEPVVEETPDVAEEEAPVPAAPEAEQAAPAEVAAPRRRARIKTTFLGLDHVDHRLNDLIASEPVKKTAVTTSFPVGWLVIVSGPGRGTSLALTEGLLQVGRNDDQALQLDFGDNGISRSNHAVIAYDAEERKCFLGHGGKANLVRLNGSPVLSTLPLNNGDMIRISETTMRFVVLCDENFDWRDAE